MGVKQTFGIVLVIALALWAITSAALVVADLGDADGTVYFSYATFGVAPLVAAIALWLLVNGA